VNNISIKALARLAGINCSYRRYDGARVDAAPTSIIAILESMGLPASTSNQIRESYAYICETRQAALPPLIVSNPDDPSRITLNHKRQTSAVQWRLTREDGSTAVGLTLPEAWGEIQFFQLPPQPPGYHVIEALGARAHLISAPARCWAPDWFSNSKGWGVNAQVYALKSDEDFGIGGFSEIAMLARACGKRGASFLGLSPLHALFCADSSKCSPYSPSNRLMLEPLFIDPRAISSFASSSAPHIYEASDYQTQLKNLRNEKLVDYHHVWELLHKVLEPAWRSFRDQGITASFVSFKSAIGAPLADHALFQALSEQFSAQGRHCVGAWPQTYQDLKSAAVDAARYQLSDRVDFHAWLQWVADEQLNHAAKAAKSAGMEIGLYRDLAVGADREGSEVWRDRKAVLPSVSIGAPPDLFAPQGQNWGLPPLDPVRLEIDGLHAFRDLVRSNMRHAGALRIDHAFQLERLYMIPTGAQADAGAYVNYPLEALLACLRIESHRANALVIAEDLGTAPPGFLESITASGILSSRVMLFERDANRGFLPPANYARQALASFTTHDLPTLRGWRSGLDIDMRNCFFNAPNPETAHIIREHETRALNEALEAESLLPANLNASRMHHAVLHFMARTPALLLTIQAEDIINDAHQPNLPGPDNGYPNWRRRMEESVCAIARPDGPLAKAGACMALENRGLRLGQSVLASDPPRATYRLQLNATFTFDDAAALAPYLARLGISHIYASPIYASAPDSVHGYDVIDYTRINPVLGGEDGFLRLSAALKANGLKMLLDFVPNHMSKSTDVRGENLMWRSTLESGPLSPFARVFDIDWERDGPDGKILLPCLQESLRNANARKKLQLQYKSETGEFCFAYETQIFPIRLHDYNDILKAAITCSHDETLRNVFLKLASGIQSAINQNQSATGEVKRLLSETTQANPESLKTINSVLAQINDDRTPASLLLRLLHCQFYRLAHWRTADSQLNARRFFNVNSLIGVRVEDPSVFDIIHSHLFKLIDGDHVHGLRIDHIDGLARPDLYLKRLQEHIGPGFYIIVEKILGSREKLPNWHISGTTGYDALVQLDSVFVAQVNQAQFERRYESVRADDRPIHEQLKSIKTELLQTTFQSERDALVEKTMRLGDDDDLTKPALANAWMELIAEMPVYRSYLADRSASRESILELLASIEQRHGDNHQAITFIGSLLTHPNPDYECIELRIRFEQLSGPAMAKGLEDTLFYRNARFIALNEVGADPELFGISVEDFHTKNTERLAHCPNSLIATQTHDTKRGEDLRARLLTLSFMPDIWGEFHELARSSTSTPDANDQYFLLQNIIGAWPVDLATGEPLAANSDFIARLKTYITKALRESRRRSSWSNRNERYETDTQNWLENLFSKKDFLDCVEARMGHLARAGFSISLARTALKLTIPGIPDLYQGCEGADYALVDPDNRKLVDFKTRTENFKSIQQSFDWRKQALIATLLRDRLRSPDLYAQGEYEPLPTQQGWVAFRRTHRDKALLVAVRLNPITQTPPPAWAIENKDWRNLLLSRALKGYRGDCFSKSVIILKSAMNDT